MAKSVKSITNHIRLNKRVTANLVKKLKELTARGEKLKQDLVAAQKVGTAKPKKKRAKRK